MNLKTMAVFLTVAASHIQVFGNQLGFLQQPSSVAAGMALAPPIEVGVLDDNGNVVTNDNASQIVISSSVSVFGTTSATVVNGVATFANLWLGAAGTGYTLTASSGTLVTNSAPFAVLPGPPVALVFVQPPSTSVAGTSVGTVSVEIRDAYGNVAVNSEAQITLSAKNAAGSSVAIYGTTTTLTTGGLATFSNAYLTLAGTGYTLTAVSSGVASANSPPFSVLPGPPAFLTFLQQPTDSLAGTAISPAVTVGLYDAYGNLAVNAVAQITVSAKNAGGNPVAVLGSTNVVSLNGVAAFSSIYFMAGGTNILTASSSGLTATSHPFLIASASYAAQLAFGVQPSDTKVGAAISPAVTVLVLDQHGVLMTNNSATQVTISSTGTRFTNSTLTATAVNGAATFASLFPATSGSNIVLTATSPSLTPAISTAFNVQKTVVIPPVINCYTAVYLNSTNLTPGAAYQIQVSADLSNWTNSGDVLVAATNYWNSTNYWPVAGGKLFFRLQPQ